MSIKFSNLVIGLYLQEFLARQWDTFLYPHQWRNTSKFIRQGKINCLVIHKMDWNSPCPAVWRWKFFVGFCRWSTVLKSNTAACPRQCITLDVSSALFFKLAGKRHPHLTVEEVGDSLPHVKRCSACLCFLHPSSLHLPPPIYLFTFFPSLSTYTFSIQVHTLLCEIHKPPLF